jgi:hypothetical protein
LILSPHFENYFSDQLFVIIEKLAPTATIDISTTESSSGNNDDIPLQLL